jgi:hypothetical protein
VKILCGCLLTSLIVLTGCGGNSSSSAAQKASPLSGNWQFTMANPADNSFIGALQGGFLLQSQNSVTGQAAYSVALPGAAGAATVCSSGSAPITGSVSGQTVNLTAVAGGQTFTLTGTLSSDGSTIMGTYSSTAGTAANGQTACGTAQSGLQWSAISVPALSGSLQGVLHSAANSLVANQDFSISGALSQGENVGASSATVTGTLTFQNYPCLSSSATQTLNVNGEISGSSVLLQLFDNTGAVIGQIGTPAQPSAPNPVVFESVASGGAVLEGTGGYHISTKACPSFGGGPGDTGNICLALGSAGVCTQPITLSPAAVTFPPMLVGSQPLTQTIKLTNTDPAGSTLTGLTLLWSPEAGYASPFYNTQFGDYSDFSGVANFTEQDTCVSPAGAPAKANVTSSPFGLAPQQSCTITVSFSPQQSCTWLPSFVAPSSCPPFVGATVPAPPSLAAALTITSPKSVDSDTTFVAPITGQGMSAIVPSTPELDFGSVALSESSPPQTLSLTNQGTLPVQILPAANKPCVNPATGYLTLAQPVRPGDVDGIRTLPGGGILAETLLNASYTAQINTIQYLCDADLTSGLPNFQISSDSCTGSLLQPGGSCSLSITYVPQPATPTLQGLDYFLELNTQQCAGGGEQAGCEIDSGRFPVELKTNLPSPLRMSPGAGLNFGLQAKGTPSLPLSVTLFNDPNDPHAGTVVFKGTIVTGDFTETDNCGGGLAPGSSCTMSVIFTATSTFFERGAITIGYTVPTMTGEQTQTIRLWGTGY